MDVFEINKYIAGNVEDRQFEVWALLEGGDSPYTTYRVLFRATYGQSGGGSMLMIQVLCSHSLPSPDP